MPPNCGRMTQVHLVFNTSASCCMPHATCHAKNHSSRCRLHQRCRTQLRLCLCAAFWVTTRQTEALCLPTPPPQPRLVSSALLQLKCKEITLKNICCACQLAAATLRSTSAYSAHPLSPLSLSLSFSLSISAVTAPAAFTLPIPLAF